MSRNCLVRLFVETTAEAYMPHAVRDAVNRLADRTHAGKRQNPNTDTATVMKRKVDRLKMNGL
jgi:hypothetical protein